MKNRAIDTPHIDAYVRICVSQVLSGYGIISELCFKF